MPGMQPGMPMSIQGLPSGMQPGMQPGMPMSIQGLQPGMPMSIQGGPSGMQPGMQFGGSKKKYKFNKDNFFFGKKN